MENPSKRREITDADAAQALAAFNQWRSEQQYDRTCPWCGRYQLTFIITPGESYRVRCAWNGCFDMSVPDDGGGSMPTRVLP